MRGNPPPAAARAGEPSQGCPHYVTSSGVARSSSGGVAVTTATRDSNARVVLWSMTLANAMILLDQTAVPLALPNIMQDFGVGSQQVQWILNASLPPLAGLLVLGG